MKTKHSTREEWLTEAIKRMEPWMKAAGGGATPKVRVSVGWPLGGRATPKKEGDNYRIGECFAPAVSKDGTSEIFISPLLADPPLVLATLAHELVHAYVGVEAKHGPNFKVVAVKLDGEFDCRLREHFQCGPRGLAHFHYRLTMEGKELWELPETKGIKNFLVEHYGLADRIAEIFGEGVWAASCEALAGSLVHVAVGAMGGRATRVHCSIKPGELAEIQLEWRAGQSLPSLLAERIK